MTQYRTETKSSSIEKLTGRWPVCSWVRVRVGLCCQFRIKKKMLRGNRSRSPPARRLVSANANTPRNNDSNNDGWVEVKWMPHSSLSNTSHVTLGVLSIHADNHQHGSEPLEFTLRVEIGLLSSQTTACTDGVWNEVVQLPIRWRDLPRDACCKIQVLQPNGQVVSRSTFARLSDV